MPCGIPCSYGVVLAGVLFVWCLGTPDSYAQQFDNISHLGTIQGFVDSGVWSPFSSSLYASAADAAINPLPGGGLYPTAWYSVAALAVTSTGVSAACAENVANFVFVAFVLPSSAFGFMRVLFDGKRSVVPFGAPCTLLFAGFPWMLILFGPLYPNLSAFCMVPAVAAVFLLLFQKGCTRGQRIGLACLFVMAIISLALAQPNAVFTLAVLLAPFCIWQVSRVPEELMHVRGAVLAPLRVLFGGLALAVIAGIWMALYNAPFLASVVQHTWLPYADSVRSVPGCACVRLHGRWLAGGARSACRGRRGGHAVAAALPVAVVFLRVRLYDLRGERVF